MLVISAWKYFSVQYVAYISNSSSVRKTAIVEVVTGLSECNNPHRSEMDDEKFSATILKITRKKTHLHTFSSFMLNCQIVGEMELLNRRKLFLHFVGY